MSHYFIRIILIFFLATVTAVPSHAEQIFSISLQNTQRLYRLHNAKPEAQIPRPLVVHLHGLRNRKKAEGGTKTLDYIYWEALGNEAIRDDFVVAFPAAKFGQWRLFPGLPNVMLKSGEEVDDIAFIFALVKELIEKKIADPKRIYLTGISDGAIMSYKLLCEPNSPFVAAVPIVGGMYEKHATKCNAKNLPAIMVIAGTNDPILPYDGWIFKTGREISIPETMEFWRNLHDCTGQKAKMLEDIDTTDNSRIRLIEWTYCKKEGAVKLMRAEGSGHAVPDFEPVSADWQKKSGGQNRDISSAAEAWKFLSQFAAD